MIGRLETVVLDCADTHGNARFWATVLGLVVVREDGGWIDLGPPGGGPDDRVLSFQHAPEHVAPTWPDPTVPQQIHLDVAVDDIEAADEQVIALGAQRLPHDEPGFRVYADPAGHPFCLTFDEG